MKLKYCFIPLLSCVFLTVAKASNLTIPKTFVANQPAIAADVNENFTSVESSVDDNDARLDALETLVTQLQSQLTVANNKIAALENNTVLELDGLLILSNINGYNTAEFTNVNVQINNGSNQTLGTYNGLGNLTIGYNETSTFAPEFCSDGLYVNESSCTSNSNIWSNNVRRGSHNLILGLN